MLKFAYVKNWDFFETPSKKVFCPAQRLEIMAKQWWVERYVKGTVSKFLQKNPILVGWWLLFTHTQAGSRLVNVCDLVGKLIKCQIKNWRKDMFNKIIKIIFKTKLLQCWIIQAIIHPTLKSSNLKIRKNLQTEKHFLRVHIWNFWQIPNTWGRICFVTRLLWFVSKRWQITWEWWGKERVYKAILTSNQSYFRKFPYEIFIEWARSQLAKN